MAKKAPDPSSTPSAPAPLRSSLGYVSEREFAAFLGITLATLRNRQSQGRLPPHYKLGRDKLYRLPDIESWVARRRCKRGAP